MRLIEKVWFQGHIAKYLLVPLLLPFSLLFIAITAIRRLAYRLGIKKSVALDVPVVVVGNIGVGGNGKTPLVIYLVELCKSLGLKPGVISRGYGSKAPHYPYLIEPNSTAEQCGDEPYLIFQRCQVPIAIGADRISDGNLLISKGCDIIIADDGLQHYRLERSLEYIVIDANRMFGNGLRLPAGPLRESVAKVAGDANVVLNGLIDNSSSSIAKFALNKPAASMVLKGSKLINLYDNSTMTIEEFVGDFPHVNALAGIGDPQRFFDTLKTLSFVLNEAKGFVDHHDFNQEDLLSFSSELPLLMTEKDAVKCLSFAPVNCWYLPVDASFDDKEIARFQADISALACKNK